ncbi:TPR-like protein [Pyrenochaeta sp. DS3sAY3a]|nr:TPR-like protein [Pyrenochaeta sp. DS3sAY3a]
MVPRPVNSLFTGRTQLLQRIESALQNDGASNSRRKQLVITGLGGMGKSEVCLQVANTLRKDFWGVFWVDVGSDTTAKNGFLAIAKALGSFAASIEDSLLALASTQRRWLLILDNADDPELDYSRYFPSGIEGTVLLTSRVPQCSQYSAVLAESLGALDVQHSVQLLLKAARVPEDQWQGCDKQAQDIVHLLGSHTLALIQAGAYIAEGYCSLDQYIAKYQRQRKRLLEHYPIQEQSRYRDVYATFEASAEVLNRDEAGRDALELLEILASLSSSVFPLQLFADAWEQATRVLKPITEWTELGELGRWHALQLPGFVDGKADEWDDYRLKKASALLASLSLVTRNSTGGIDGLSMHPLTHVWARDRLRTQRRQQAWVSAGCTLALSRGRSEPWHPCERELLPHVQSLLASTVETVLTLGSRQEMLTVLVHCGWILDDMREDVRLEALLLEIYEQLQIAPEVPSEEHVAIWDLAGANVMHMGHTGQAVALLKHVVKVRESTLAESHLSRLMSQHGLAEAYIFNKQIMEAIALLEQLVKVEATTLAESHPFRLASQHILAMAYCGNRQMKEALELLPHVVKVREMTLAETHLDRLASQHELARAYHSNGQTKEAVALLEHVVKVQDITLVETHPNRLTSQHELAIVFHTNGQIKEAVTLLEHVVKVREMTLPETHPDQLASQHVLARAYHSNGQTREAVALLEHVVAVEGRILPAGHPSRIASIEELEYIKALEDLKVRWIGDRS